MKFNKLWIDELVPGAPDTDTLADMITMAGLEVDSVSPVAGAFDGVVVGEVLTCAAHPDSDHLHVTTVDAGGGEILDIVCGAPNCRAGLKVACAKVGASLPGGLRIGSAKLRGAVSNGMLCSARELGMSEDHDGILELPEDAPVGADLRKYLRLDDRSVELDLTANRADCLSVRGIAREVGVLASKDVVFPEIPPVPAAVPDRVAVEVRDPAACPRYISRVVRNAAIARKSPLWLRERLRRCGIRPVDAIVDITNYVMLETGQPMHAFDLDRLNGGIVVRQAEPGEKLVLLSGAEAVLKAGTLVIADASGPVALAGIFGGEAAGVHPDTVNVALESAFFSPAAIKNRAREYGLATDASHRYERGVDPAVAREAMERATALILEICGGEAGPVNETVSPEHLPVRGAVTTSFRYIDELLGVVIPPETVTDILARLGMNPEPAEGGAAVRIAVPSWRYDIAIPADVAEEVARVFGYDNIPARDPVAPLRMLRQSEGEVTPRAVKTLLADLGYHEVVTYSFVDPESLRVLDPEHEAVILPAPISAEMSAMRTTLWAGLAGAVRYNVNRQAVRMKIFECGQTFLRDPAAENGILQEEHVAGAIYGSADDESWNRPSRDADFFDLKGDVERLLGLTGSADEFTFERASLPALHPGVSAAIRRRGEIAGYAGLIHPAAQKKLGLRRPVFLFDLRADALKTRRIPSYAEISKFPSIRRDFAIVLDAAVPADRVVSVVRGCSDLARDVNVFDVFSGEGVPEGKKSVAFSVTLQSPDKTLEDADVAAFTAAAVGALGERLGAVLRE